MPRKPRFQGSIDELSGRYAHALTNTPSSHVNFLRYRCLDAIVRAAFPNDAIATVDDLRRLGKRLGYQMPETPDEPPVELKDLFGPSRLATEDANYAPAPQVALAEDDEGTTSPTFTAEDLDSPGLVRDSTGHAHHIGPSGSLAFFASLRHLIASRCNSAANSLNRSSGFADDNAATTLESDRTQDSDDLPNDSAREEDPVAVQPSPCISSQRSDHKLEQPDMAEQEKNLPSSSIMTELIQSYFDHVHLDFPLFHRATFEEEYECFILGARSDRKRPTNGYLPFPDCGWGWLGCLHMMLVFGSLIGEAPNSATCRLLRRNSVSLVRSFLPHIVTKSSLWNVRCLVLLSLYLHNNSERNAAWMLAGTATRTALALGLHRRDLDSSFRPIEREMRKRAFCSLYSYEQFLCSTLGRPSGMGDPDVEVTPPREGFLYNGNTITELTAASMELQKLLSRTRRATSTDGTILEALRRWKSQLPEFLDLPRCISYQDISIRGSASNPPAHKQLRTILSHQPPARVRSVLLLHIQYHYIAVLVTRSALLHFVASTYDASSAAAPGPGRIMESSVDSAEASVYHACQLSSLIGMLYRFNLLRGESALDVFYGYSAGMILVLRLLCAPLPEGSTTTERGRELQIRVYLESNTSSLRDVIRRTSKSPTMMRFASVLESFSSLLSNPIPLQTTAHPSSNYAQTESANEANQHAIAPLPAGAVLDIANASPTGVTSNGTRNAQLNTDIFGARIGTDMGLPRFHNIGIGESYDRSNESPNRPNIALTTNTDNTFSQAETFDELPHLPLDFSWSPLEHDLGVGWADFESLIGGNDFEFTQF
ncbi:hypothetical protein NA57DRAFT_49272 [Rhizodiscina lignyota]|uniref:Xylanolytic transcriptional activator regulatory domain-containing protein n=1 Tax=Rhizodiscina lignyota TaxID=1504668 RepID=A0A9P4I5L4_9PEZI|nr:hypothetical protein NA57DRAFT_49272 [Rhizodiscina lignyota]